MHGGVSGGYPDGAVHPMFVVRVSTILEPSFTRIRSHEELKAEGLLVEYEDWMSVLFCSHTWLRRNYPDNEAGVKLTLLKSVLQSALKGTLDITPHWMTEFLYKKAAKHFRLHAADMHRNLAHGFVFLDYFSIPQANPDAQARAIASLVSYVNASTYFLCLTGPWTHEDGSPRDDAAWAGRGWCRMECTANALSPSIKPIIVANSPTSIVTFPPGGTVGRDWLVSARVGKGTFTVEADKLVLGPVLRDLIAARKGLALSARDFTFYRILHAASSWLLDGCGIEVAEEPFDEWMATMRFTTAKDDAQRTGLTPLHFAIMTGRPALVEALLDRHAPIECKSKVAEPSFQIAKGHTPLVIAGAYARNGTIIELLLRRGADPRQILTREGYHALFHTAGYGNIEGMRAFMRHDATLVNLPNELGHPPTTMAIMFGHMHLTAMLRDEYPKQFEATVQNHDASLCAAGICSLMIANGVASLDLISTILDAGEPVDRHALKVTNGPLASILRMVDLIAWLRPVNKLPNLVLVLSYVYRSTALHFAAYNGQVAVVGLLLSRGAPINSTANPKRMTPLHLATIGGHPDVVTQLLEMGADPSVKDKRGRTALAYATKLHIDAVRGPLLTACEVSTERCRNGQVAPCLT